MNQLMRVGNGVVFAIDRRVTMEEAAGMQKFWREQFPDIPFGVFPETQIVQQGDTTLFQFSGDISPTVVAEFRRWWEEVTREHV